MRLSKKRNFKSNSGITLVALIITIIVLLILAMVSIRLVMNGGIIDRANRGTQAYSEAEIQEQIKLAYSEWQTAQFTGDSNGDAATFMQTRLRTALKDNGLAVSGSNGVFVVKLSNNDKYIYDTTTGKMLDEVPISAYPTVTASTNNSAVTENSKYISNGKTAVIPAGYTISSVEAEQSIDTGLVISKDSNEWVWIPVSSSDLAAMYTEDSTGWTMNGTDVVTKYKSNSEIISGKTRVSPGDTSDWCEPDIITGKNYMGISMSDDVEANYRAAGFTSFLNMATSLRDDYKAMIDSVRKYGGFYVGRYELSNAGTKKGEASLTNTDWYNLYKKCKDIDSSGVETSMIWGCLWDQVCKFISTAKDANGDTISLTDSSKYGNYRNALAPANTGNYESNTKKNTGSNEAWKTNNIYDLAGNCMEWTQEANSNSSRAFRGGRYSYVGDSSDNNVISRSSGGHYANYGGDVDTSRPILYIK